MLDTDDFDRSQREKMKKQDQTFTRQLLQNILWLAFVPNIAIAALLFAAVICENQSFCMAIIGFAGFLLLLPISLYYLLPAIISGGLGFAGGVGLAPEKPIAYLISIACWSLIAFVLTLVIKMINEIKRTT